MSPARYSQNVSNCDEEKEIELTCHTKPYAVMPYKADAVSQSPSVLLVQSTGLAIDLINWSWDKVQFMQHNSLQNVHRVSQNVLQERKSTELNGCSTALEPVADKQRRLCMYQVSGQMFCATDIWDTKTVKHMQGSPFYFHFPLSGAITDRETNEVIYFLCNYQRNNAFKYYCL